EPASAPPALDPDQAAAVAWEADAGNLLVVGAPGTGKTTTAIASFLHRAGRTPEQAADQGVLLLVPTRRAAARVRDVVATRLARTTRQVLVRTPASFAYSVLRMRATLLGEPAPTLITGPEQDQILAELLEGHRAGLGAHVRWPDAIGPETLAMSAFRGELRDLFMRAAELGLGPEELAERGHRHGRPEWVGAAVLLDEYQEVTALGELTPDRGARRDAARIVDEATAALLAWEAEVPAHPRPRWSAVVVDDHQDSTLATARLLRALADDGAQLLLHGDPDAGVQGVRGGAPALVGLAAPREGLGGFAAPRHRPPAAGARGRRCPAPAARRPGRRRPRVPRRNAGARRSGRDPRGPRRLRGPPDRAADRAPPPAGPARGHHGDHRRHRHHRRCRPTPRGSRQSRTDRFLRCPATRVRRRLGRPALAATGGGVDRPEVPRGAPAARHPLVPDGGDRPFRRSRTRTAASHACLASAGRR